METELLTTGARADVRTAELFDRYRPQIQRYCHTRLRSREEAEDAVQNVFLRVHAALRKGVVPELEAPWLYKIAHNVCISRALGAKRRARVESPADMAVLGERFAARARERPDDLLGLEDALARMPANLRRAVLLREWQGLSYAEIAEELGQSKGAVETLIFRARRHLAKALGLVNVFSLVGLSRKWLYGAAAPAKVAAGTLVVAGLAGGGLVVGEAVRPADARPAAVVRPGPAVRAAAHAVTVVHARPVVKRARRPASPRTDVARSSSVAAAPQPARVTYVPAPPAAEAAAAPTVAAPEPAAPVASPAGEPAATTSPPTAPPAEAEPATTTLPVPELPAVPDPPAVSIPTLDVPAVPAPELPAVPPVTVPELPPVPKLP